MAAAAPRHDRFLETCALVVVALAPTQIGVPLFHLGRATVSLTAADLLIWLLAAVVVLRWVLTKRRDPIARPPLHLWLVAAIAGLSGAAWLSPALPREYVVSTAKELIQWVGFFVAAPLVFLNALTTDAGRRRAVIVLLCVTAVTVMIGLAQGALAQASAGPDWLYGTWHRELEERDVDPSKVVGLFGSRTVYGVQMAMVLPIALALAIGLRRPGAGLALTVLALAGAASVTVPGPFAAVTVGLAVAGFLAAPSGKTRWLYGVAGLVVALVGLLAGPFRAETLDWSIVYDRQVAALVEADEGGGGRADESVGPNRTVLVPTVDNRYAEWGAVMEMIGSTDDPVAVIGVGPGHYQEQIGAYLSVLPKYGKLETDFQGQYLVIVAELGLTGLAAFALFLGVSLRGALTGATRGADPFSRALHGGLAGAFSALLVANLHACPVVRGTGVTLVLLACLIIASAREPIREE